MPEIYDNITTPLLPELRRAIDHAARADFCVGYFNLRGWRQIEDKIEELTGGGSANCRLLVGMVRQPHEDIKRAYSLLEGEAQITQAQANDLRKQLIAAFREQLVIGIPSNQDEAGLQRLKRQLVDGKLVVKLFLRHPLHAKLYLLHLRGGMIPRVGYLGSSNLTFSGLSGQGELNIDVHDVDATHKLAAWFEARWDDRFCIDITQDLIQILNESWARDEAIPPYYIYLKMAYHLSREAQRGIDEFRIPHPFDKLLFDFQKAAVQIAARNLNQRGGVLIGDVVGLGKTLMATALVKIFQDDLFWETLIICPKNLERMWQHHVDTYGLRAKVLSIARVQQELPQLRRYRLVLIDESHNLRNREGVRYRAIRDYIETNECRCIMLSATPYNKTYLDLSSQLRLFVDQEADLGVRPERLIREIGIVEFNARYENTPPRSLLAFERSQHADDWRELMRLYMVRRTRSFIRENYAREDEHGRRYLVFADGRRSYFPNRYPRRLDFAENDQYARLYSEMVVDTINGLSLPRYGLGMYVRQRPSPRPTAYEQRILDDLSRGGRRLMGFCRTNLFKRLESSGYAFLLSVERHILRNFVYLYALENGLDVPIGTQDVAVLDTRFEDADVLTLDTDDGDPLVPEDSLSRFDPRLFQERAGRVYRTYREAYRTRFRWLRADLFRPGLAADLRRDADALLTLLRTVGAWDAVQDTQLAALEKLLRETYANEKVLVFSQFADTVGYLSRELNRRGLMSLEGVDGDHPDPTYAAWRFSPVSNDKRHAIAAEQELRVLIATDVLSEGQNLQDAHVIVNYDLPWAIIRLIQRAGRVDRIGQESQEIDCYSMWPAEGLERIIRLRERLRQRLHENAEVVGADEFFFEDEEERATLVDLYNERAGLLDDTVDREVDLVSHAYQIWKNATDANPGLKTAIERLPSVVYSAKAHSVRPNEPTGVLVYLRTRQDNSALAWIDEQGNHVSQSQFDILRAAECALDTPTALRSDSQHDLVRRAVEFTLQEQQSGGIQLGRTSGVRYRVYQRLKEYALSMQGMLLARTEEMRSLNEALEQMGRYRLRETATERLNRQLRSGLDNEQLARLVVTLFQDGDLCIVHDEGDDDEPQIICSLGLVEE